MAMNSSGPIQVGGTIPGQSIEYELLKSGTEQLAFGEEKFRRLTGQPSGQVDINSIFGKNYTWSDTQISCNNLGGAGSLFDGSSVSISGDGNTLAIGAPMDTTNAPRLYSQEYIGCVFIFTRSGDSWNFQTRIQPTGWNIYSFYVAMYGQSFSYGPEIGSSVALSYDGNYLAIGGPRDNSAGTQTGVGRVWIYTRSGTTWSQQTSLVPPDFVTSGSAYCGFGLNIAMTPDATTLVIGGPDDNSNTGGNGSIGAAWIYTRSGTTWSKQAKLIPSGYIQGYGGNYFGTGLSISADGNTVSIGARGERNGTYGGSGACYIFVRNGSSWSQQIRLSPTLISGLPNGSYFGKSTALSSDGNTLVVSAPQNYSLHWGPNIFTRSGTTWSFRKTLTSTSAKTLDYQGSAVGIAPNPYNSSQYDVMFTCGQDANSAVSIFTGNAGTWSETSYVKPSHPSFPATLSYYYIGAQTTTDYSPMSVSSNSRIFVTANRYGQQVSGGVTVGGTLVFSK